MTRNKMIEIREYAERFFQEELSAMEDFDYMVGGFNELPPRRLEQLREDIALHPENKAEPGALYVLICHKWPDTPTCHCQITHFGPEFADRYDSQEAVSETLANVLARLLDDTRRGGERAGEVMPDGRYCRRVSIAELRRLMRERTGTV